MDTKVVFYLSDKRSVTLTDIDSEHSMRDLESNIADALSGDSLCSFSTNRDRLILRPQAVVGVHIQQLQNSKYDDCTLGRAPNLGGFLDDSIIFT